MDVERQEVYLLTLVQERTVAVLQRELVMVAVISYPSHPQL